MITVAPRPYQTAPLTTFYARRNILLAFDTGLGKTYCAIAAAEELLESGRIDRVLLVVPAGLKYQWAEAIARFTDLPTQTKVFKKERLTIPDSRYCMVVDGTPERRRKQYKLARETVTCNYIVIGYDNVSSDTRDVKRVNADMIVLDEASAIKTLGAQRTKDVKEHLHADWRMALTATPIDTRPDELFSIMEWVDEAQLGRGDLFDMAFIERNHFGDPIGYKNLPALRRRLGNAMYRKSVVDPDVAPFMPKREFLDWRVHMDAATKAVYTKMAYDLLAALNEALSIGKSFNASAHYAGQKADEGTPAGKVMAIHTAMEMLLDHPDLLVASALDYAETKDKGSKYASEVYASGLIDDLEHSPKLASLTYRLGLLMEQTQNKVIIFTRYRTAQWLIMETCREYGWDAVDYHGELTTAEQQAARARFLRDPACRVFVSTHAGERGTDLPVANWLVNFDAVWSSGQADQINGRHMRTSSEFEDIYVANMFTDGTIEERKLEQQDEKRRLAQAVVDGVMPRSGRIELSTEGLKAHVEAWLQDNDPDGMISYMIQ